MRTIKLEVYEFQELNDAAKTVAIEEYRDINTDYNWWEYTYEDAENIGLELQGFDLYARKIDAGLLFNVEKCCKEILAQHGETTETYKLATAAINWIEDSNKMSEDEMALIEERFLNGLKRIYLTMLIQEYEYLESDTAVIDTIIANEYEFYENGQKY